MSVPSDESAVKRIADVDHVNSTILTLTVHDDTRTTHVVPTSDHEDVARDELKVQNPKLLPL